MSASLLRSRLAFSTPSLRQAPRRAAARQCRHASSSSSGSSSPMNGLRFAAYSGAVAVSACAAYLYMTDTRASVHGLVPRILRVVLPDAEDAHHGGTLALRILYELNLHPRERDASLADAPELRTSVFDTELANPIGISAGLDKNAEVPDVLFDLGAGVVEVGGCTPRPQEGNPRPRVFRVTSLEGMVNRYGLNSIGADAMAVRLRDRLRRFAHRLGVSESDVLDGGAGVPPGSLRPGRLLAVQIAKNKDTNGSDEQAVADDHAYCTQRLAPYADILVVNVSSPNTPGLRDLQATGPLTRLLSVVVKEAADTGRRQRPKVMVKVSPDEDDDEQVRGIVAAVSQSGVDGIIVGNTTKRRVGLGSDKVQLSSKEQKALAEEGGYSGPAMFDRTVSLVGKYRAALQSATLQSADGAPGAAEKVIFATGGVTNGEQALKLLNAGASIAMVYTTMVYNGAGTVTRIKGEMRDAVKSQS